MVQEFAMEIAHDVAMFEGSIARSVESRLRQRIGKDRMDMWFGGDAKWTQIGHNVIGIQVASPFVADCVSKMFRDDLQAAVVEAAGSHFGFQISFASPLEAASPKADTTSQVPPESSVLVSKPVAKPKAFNAELAQQVTRKQDHAIAESVPTLRVVRKDGMGSEPDSGSAEFNETLRAPVDVQVGRLIELRRENERRWDEFVAGDHNRLAYTAAEMVLERPGQLNPLLIHGPSGTGKSHLAIGLAHKMRMTYNMRRVLVLTAEQFTIDYTESARGGGFANFRRKYRDVEAIVIDDIQFCLGKGGTLVELRNTIDMLLRDKRQVVLVADRGLNELSGLGADLYARLSGGMACAIDPLDAKTRTEVLKRMCLKSQVDLSELSVKELAEQCCGDARVLQGVSHRLVAQQRVVGRQLTDDEAIRCTLDLIRASHPIVRMNDIEKVVCEAFGLDGKSLREKTKCQTVSQPRMLAMFLARKYTRTALSEIGDYFGKRQHSTVISAQKKVESWLQLDELIGCGRGKVAVRDILKSLEATLQVG
jgi:chromosomal replication initiator protein